MFRRHQLHDLLDQLFLLVAIDLCFAILVNERNFTRLEINRVQLNLQFDRHALFENALGLMDKAIALLNQAILSLIFSFYKKKKNNKKLSVKSDSSLAFLLSTARR